MKLYFYVLNQDIKTDELKLCVEECDVVEKPKTYKPVTRFPSGLYLGGFIKKESIGHFVGNWKEIIVLDRPDYKKAKEIFFKKYDREIRMLKSKISSYELFKKAIENYEDDES